MTQVQLVSWCDHQGHRKDLVAMEKAVTHFCPEPRQLIVNIITDKLFRYFSFGSHRIAFVTREYNWYLLLLKCEFNYHENLNHLFEFVRITHCQLYWTLVWAHLLDNLAGFLVSRPHTF